MKQRVKILFVAEEIATNGAMKSLVTLLNALPNDKYALSLFLFKQGETIFDKIPSYVHILKELYPYYIHRSPLREAIKSAMSRVRVDMIFYRVAEAFRRKYNLSYYLWPFLPRIQGEYDLVCSYADGFVSPMIMKKTSARKKACWIHIPYSKWEQPEFVYEALKQADVCVPVSFTTGKDLDNVLGQCLNKQVVHNLIDAGECIKLAEEPCEKERVKDVFRIVSVGRVTPPKFFDIIPATAKLLLNKGIDFEWYIIGDGDKYDELTNIVLAEQLTDHVHFIGSRANAMPWIMSCDVFVNPSRFESWGMTVSEALCLGKAVITSDIDVFAEQINDGINGIMVKVTPENLATAIEYVLTNPDKKYKLEQNAKNYPFGKDTVIGEFGKMVSSLNL